MESKLFLLPSSPSYSNWWSPDVLPPPERESREGITTPTRLSNRVLFYEYRLPYAKYAARERGTPSLVLLD